MCFADPELCVDADEDEALISALDTLKSDPSYRDYLNASVGAVNRALSILEMKRLIPMKERAIRVSELKMINNMCIFDLSSVKDLYSIESVSLFSNGRRIAVPFDASKRELLLPTPPSDSEYVIAYIPRVERVKAITAESYNIDLCDSICELIPYYVAGDILRTDDSEGAERLRSYFLALCDMMPRPADRTDGVVASVYGSEQL